MAAAEGTVASQSISLSPPPPPPQQSGSKKTASRCTTEKAEGTHFFEIVGYSLMKGMGVGKFVRSATFTVGGFDWGILFYPDGRSGTGDCVAADLEFRSSKGMEARACFDMRLVNQDTRLAHSLESILPKAIPTLYNDFSQYCRENARVIEKSHLEEEGSGYIKDDSLTIECVLTVMKQSLVAKITGDSEIQVPPSNLSSHFGKLLLEEKGADLTLSVGGESFAAHKIVLAARSPVFEAELYGQMKEREDQCIIVEDMQPGVFKAMLHFIYTDSLPCVDDLGDDDYSEMIRHLLVAADRYAMDRMKLMCQNILSENLALETVATTLALADQYNCDRLKDVCIKFIASTDEMDALMATQGYMDLKRTCPFVFADVFEKSKRLRKA